MSPPSTSASLLLRLRQLSAREDWQRFVDLYKPFLQHCARRLGMDATEADDLIQEVFVILMEQLPTFVYQAGKSFRAWLRTILKNQWIDYGRRHLHDPQAISGAAEDILDAAEPFWETEYRKYLIHRALELMKADFQPTTWKACWEVVALGRKAAEVADELGMTVGAVHAACFRVLARLRQELAGLLD